MASFSTSLEQALRRALQYANERSHEYATLEHLLLSLIDDRDAAFDGADGACSHFRNGSAAALRVGGSRSGSKPR